jgi:hypothetical protein
MALSGKKDSTPKVKSLKPKGVSAKQGKTVKGGFPVGPPQMPQGPPQMPIGPPTIKTTTSI